MHTERERGHTKRERENDLDTFYLFGAAIKRLPHLPYNSHQLLV